jgi:hypothetical protein
MTKQEARERLQPTDIICLVSMGLLAGLYAITREPDLKSAFLALIVFVGGRQSKVSSMLNKP